MIMTIEVSSLEQIAATIREQRRLMKVSQKRLAKMCGMSQSTIARIETDVVRLNPSYASVFYVASALNKLSTNKPSSVRTMTVKEIMHRHIISITPSASVYDAIELFKDYDFPQLPVLDGSRRVVGTVYQKDLLDDAMHNPDMVKRRRVGSVMKASLPQIDRDAEIAGLKIILESSGGVIVVERGKAVGIITVYDILKTV